MPASPSTHLAAGGTLTATRKYILTAADIAAGKLEPVTFDATANNGAKGVSATVSGGAIQARRAAGATRTGPTLDSPGP